ncbi:MAG: Molybdate/tungstate transport system permease protein WtpB [Candidatus Methanolliviera sp. GoM_asphalt]|nr:MAG: Molybdate/tungstate transport system permease protein WtpB [Candidatus Methanolliviera sp. GoM_asphalt]
MRIKQEKMLIFFCILSFFILFFIIIVLAEPIFSQFLFSLDDFFSTCRDPEVLSCIGLTIGTSFLATGVASLFGIPLAYILARKEFFGKRMVESVVDLPIMVPHMVAGIALFSVFHRHGLIGAPLSPIIKFFDAIPGIVVAMLFVSAPFLINPVREGFQSVDPHLENVARSLGASEWKAFYKVTIPIAYRHILSGIGMSWGRGVSEFAAVLLLAYYPMVASTLIYERFLMYGLAGSRPIAVLLMLICLGIFLSFRSVRR